MNRITTLIVFLFLNSSYIYSHPVHISIVNIDYIESEHIFQISIKLFTDDFEKIINYHNNTKLNIGKANEHNKCNEYINQYIKHNLIFKINNKNILKNSTLLKKEVHNEENVTWLFYKIKYSSGKKVSISNTLLNDLYKDQKNLFIFTFKNTQEAYKFEKNKTNFEFLIK